MGKAARVVRTQDFDPWIDPSPVWNDMPEDDEAPSGLEVGWAEDASAAMARRAEAGQVYRKNCPLL